MTGALAQGQDQYDVRDAKFMAFEERMWNLTKSQEPLARMPKATALDKGKFLKTNADERHFNSTRRCHVSNGAHSITSEKRCIRLRSALSMTRRTRAEASREYPAYCEGSFGSDAPCSLSGNLCSDGICEVRLASSACLCLCQCHFFSTCMQTPFLPPRLNSAPNFLNYEPYSHDQ